MPHFYQFLLCCCILYSTASLPAQSSLGNNYAYFFYTTDFLPGWENLPETATEAKAIGEILEEQYDFEVKYISNPDKAAILSQITKINNRRYGQNDQVLFFFSMHGHFDRAADRGYLIPADGKIPSDDPYGQSWISYDDLGSYITKNPAEHILLALDACYSGAFGDRYRGRPDAAPWQQEGDCQEKAKQALTYNSRLYFSSGSREQRTPARSLFAKKWLEALRNGAQSGLVRFNDLRYYLGDISYPVPEGGSFTGRHKAGGDFVFLHKEACAKANVAQADEAEEQLWQQALRLNTREAFAFYTQAYPQGRHKYKAEKYLDTFSDNIDKNQEGTNLDHSGENVDLNKSMKRWRKLFPNRKGFKYRGESDFIESTCPSLNHYEDKILLTFEIKDRKVFNEVAAVMVSISRVDYGKGNEVLGVLEQFYVPQYGLNKISIENPTGEGKYQLIYGVFLKSDASKAYPVLYKKTCNFSR